MNDLATALFSAFDGGISSYARHTASQVRKIFVPQTLSPEQHQVLEATLRLELEAFTNFLLGRFDNVGCSLPDGVFGYSIFAQPCAPAMLTVNEPLAEVDIREDEEDYADMWQEFLVSKVSPVEAG